MYAYVCMFVCMYCILLFKQQTFSSLFMGCFAFWKRDEHLCLPPLRRFASSIRVNHKEEERRTGKKEGFGMEKQKVWKKSQPVLIACRSMIACCYCCACRCCCCFCCCRCFCCLLFVGFLFPLVHSSSQLSAYLASC